MTPDQAQCLRALPAVSELLDNAMVQDWCRSAARSDVTEALRQALDGARRRIMADHSVTPVDTQGLLRAAQAHLTRRTTASLRPVINATGVILHTGLGRAPLAESAVDAIARGAAGYTNLEYDLSSAKRGRRQDHVSGLLASLTGAEAATVVNNNAAAMLLIMRTFCDGREVVVSRGQLVEIGGSFRMPDIMKAGGAVLREVGTTNRTRLSDYERAITENTAAVLRVHHSNFRIVGFTAQPSADELVACARTNHVLAIDDLGSGAMFDFARLGLASEPCVPDSVAAGFDLVCFSGDKLLGGPQAGIILGRRDLIAELDAHPLMRTYRVDKLVLLALEATLRHYRDPDQALSTVPTLAMLCATTDDLAERARTLSARLADALPQEKFYISSDTSVAGGGSLPGEGLPTVVVRWRPSFAPVDAVIRSLRQAPTPVVARITDDQITFDLRTLRDDDFPPLVDAVRYSAEAPSMGDTAG